MGISETRLKDRWMGLGGIVIGLWVVSCTWGGSLDKAAEEAVVLREGLLLDGIGQYGSQAVYTDPLVSEIIQGRWIAPQAGQVVKDADGRDHTWRAVQANDKGWFEQRGQSGYLHLTIQSDRARSVLLNVLGPAMLYVNSEPRVGGRYASKDQFESWETNFNMTYLPVRLRAGDNDLLVQRTWRSGGRVKVAVLDTPPLLLNPRDNTLPDLTVGQDVNTIGAMVVINASEEPCMDLTLEVRWPSGRTERTAVPRIEALSLRKVAFPLRHPRFDQAGPVACQIALVRGQECLDSCEVKIEVKTKDQPRMQTFISDMDGSVQYYALREALPGPGSVGAPALVLSVHGAGVQALGQAAAYASKPWCHIVCPTNRRPYGFDWEDWGRLDTLEVLDQVHSGLAYDPSRVYLTGHSMGGHGTWILGSTYPDRFAAIGPSAGWISFWSYRGAKKPDTLSPVAKVLMRAETPSDTIRLSQNLRDRGIYILHGGADDTVRPDQAKLMIDHLQTFHHDWVYHEEPGKGHWWDLSEEEPGADCVDWAPMFDFFARHRLPVSEEVREVNFTTANPGVSARCHWAEIEAQQVPMAMSRVDLQFHPGIRAVIGTTENVSRFSLRLKGMVPDEAGLRLEIDGHRLDGVSPVPGTGQVWLSRKGSQWQVTGEPSPALKGPHRSGPFKDAFRHRMVFVYGTAGTPEETAWARAKARFDAEQWWYQGNGSVDVLPDTAFDPAVEPHRGVILYGNADTHRSWRALLGDSPVQVTRQRVTCGSRSIEAQDLACLFLRPRPGSDKACVGVVSGTGLAGLRLTDRFTYIQAGCSFPDCTVVSSRMLTDGLAGVEVAGFFGEDWSVERGDFAWAQPKTAETAKAKALPVDIGPDPRGFVHPKGYVCHRTNVPLEIDGRLDELAWTQAPWTDAFVDIKGTPDATAPRLQTRVKMLWDDKCLYIGAVLEEPHVWATLTERNAVIFNDNDFEVFLDPDGDSHRYFEFEMNALNTVWNLFLDRPYKHKGTAQVREMPGQKSGVFVKGTLNHPTDVDEYWSVEIALPFAALAEHAGCPCPPREGDQWRIDFSRVQWHSETKDGRYVRVPPPGSELKDGQREDNWVWSPQGAINMHRPETWAYVQFSTKLANEEVPFRPDPAAPARYLLHRVLYAQEAYILANGAYATSLSALGLEDLAHPSLVGPIRLTCDSQTYTAEAQIRLAPNRIGVMRLHQDGREELTDAVQAENAQIKMQTSK